MAHRPPRTVGAIATNPKHGPLVRGEVANQLLEHRIARQPVRVGVGGDRWALDRQTHEPCTYRPADSLARDVHRDVGAEYTGTGRVV